MYGNSSEVFWYGQKKERGFQDPGAAKEGSDLSQEDTSRHLSPSAKISSPPHPKKNTTTVCVQHPNSPPFCHLDPQPLDVLPFEHPIATEAKARRASRRRSSSGKRRPSPGRTRRSAADGRGMGGWFYVSLRTFFCEMGWDFLRYFLFFFGV